jgi:hypothetical protein
MYFIFLLFFIFSCSKSEKKDSISIPKDVEASLIEKKDFYLSVQSQALNEHGYAHEKCDSLGFTALCKAAGGCKDADLFKSETEGRWFRSPEKDCFDKGESQSDFSKDMALMLFVYLHKSKDLAALARFKSYVEANNYVMGRPTNTPEGLSRVVMSPSLILTMERLYKNLSGSWSGKPIPVKPAEALPIINRGFLAHLDVLSIWLNAELTEGTSDLDDFVLRSQVERQPKNAFFEAVYHAYRDGDQSSALEILADEKLFPSDRLPATKDRCEEYLFQRDYGEDWKPCEKIEVHAAVDYLFAGYVMGIW